MFDLSKHLKEEKFRQEFIQRRGYESLFKVVQGTEGNVFSYSLSALLMTLTRLEVVEFVARHQGFWNSLYDGLYCGVGTVGRNALLVLRILCRLAPDGYHKLQQAALRSSTQRQQPQYRRLIESFRDRDLLTQEAALLLCNEYLERCLLDGDIHELIQQLTDQGIHETLDAVESISTSQPIQEAIKQLRVALSATTASFLDGQPSDLATQEEDLLDQLTHDARLTLQQEEWKMQAVANTVEQAFSRDDVMGGQLGQCAETVLMTSNMTDSKVDVADLVKQLQNRLIRAEKELMLMKDDEGKRKQEVEALEAKQKRLRQEMEQSNTKLPKL